MVLSSEDDNRSDKNWGVEKSAATKMLWNGHNVFLPDYQAEGSIPACKHKSWQ
jgi:hypothetical protein